jgi:hypothetical protein
VLQEDLSMISAFHVGMYVSSSLAKPWNPLLFNVAYPSTRIHFLLRLKYSFLMLGPLQ